MVSYIASKTFKQVCNSFEFARYIKGNTLYYPGALLPSGKPSDVTVGCLEDLYLIASCAFWK